MPPKKPRGMEMTSAQGQEMTRKISARWIQMPHASWNSRGGSTASKTAAITTRGV